MGLDLRLSPFGRFVASDETNTGTTDYYGFIDKDGRWYIMKYDITNGTMRYFEGLNGYTTGWTDRASHKYIYFYELKIIKWGLEQWTIRSYHF